MTSNQCFALPRSSGGTNCAGQPPQWARPERFPEADQILATSDLGSIRIHHTDAVVIMTHSYEQDRACLIAVLPAGTRYLGLLGARHRSALLISEVAASLNWPIEQACEDPFAPTGLDLGGDGAEVIALDIISEIQSRVENKVGLPRRMTVEIIANQLTAGGNSRYLQTQCIL